MFSSLCDSIGIQRSFKRDMKVYIRKKKEEETGEVDGSDLGEGDDLRIFSKYFKSNVSVLRKDDTGL